MKVVPEPEMEKPEEEQVWGQSEDVLWGCDEFEILKGIQVTQGRCWSGDPGIPCISQHPGLASFLVPIRPNSDSHACLPDVPRETKP